METTKVPQIENLQEITPEQVKEYVQYVAELRMMQRKYFKFRHPEYLAASRQMEQDLDVLNDSLLNPQPKLF